MTEQLLWQECSEQQPANGYSDVQFCHRYLERLGCQHRSMRQVHKVGGKLLVDYCGPTMTMANTDSRDSAPNSIGRWHCLMISHLGEQHRDYKVSVESSDGETSVKSTVFPPLGVHLFVSVSQRISFAKSFRVEVRCSMGASPHAAPKLMHLIAP